MSLRLSSRAACVLLVFLSPHVGRAVNRTWTAPGSGNFGTGTNWSNSQVPGTNDKSTFSSGGTYTVVFNSAGGLLNPTVNQDVFVTNGNVTFTSTVGAPYLYHLMGTSGSASITGGSLTLGTGSNNPLNMTIDEDLIVRAALNVNAGSIVNTKDLLLAQTGSGTIVVDGTGSALNVSGLETSLGLGGNTAQLTYRNNSTGSIAGVLAVGDDSNAATTATLNVDTGADLNVGRLNIGTGTAAATGTVNVNGTGSTLVQAGATSLTVGTTSGGIGALNIGTTASGGAFTTGTGLFTINKKGTVSIGSASTSGTLSAAGNVLIDGGTLSMLGGSSAFTVAPGKSLTLQNGGLISGVITLSANATCSVTDALSQLNAGIIFGGGSQLNLTSGATYTGSVGLGSISGNDILSIQGANSMLSGTLFVSSHSTANVGTTISGAKVLANSDPFLNPNALEIRDAGTVNIGSATTTGTLELLQNALIDGGTLRVYPGSTFQLHSDIDLTVQNGGSAIFDHLALQGVTFSGSTVSVTSGAALSVDGSITTTGTANTLVRVDGGTLTAGSIGRTAFVNGTINIIGAAGVTFGSSTISQISLGLTRTLNVAYTTTIPSGRSLSVDGGTFTTGSLNVLGQFSFNSGSLNITGPSGFVIGAGQPLGADLLLYPSQLLDVTNTLTIDSAARLIALQGSTPTAGTILNNGDLVAIDADINATVINNQAVTVIGNVDFNGLVSGPGRIYGSGTAHFNGGFAPGASPANINIEGSVALAESNTLFIEIGGAAPGSQYDRLTIDGSATLDGALDISLINGFMPIGGQQFTILTASSIVNNGFTLAGSAASAFSLIVGPTSVVLQAVALTGDYNHNGLVDAADYVVWRNSTGLTGPGLVADGNNNSQIDSGDLDIWRSHFGQNAGSGAGGGSEVPEPNSLGMSVVVMMALSGRRRAVAVPA